MAMTLDGSNGVTFNDASLQGAAASPFGLKNRIINGAMVIDQRNAGASVTPTDGQFTVDRWQCWVDAASKLTAQQSTTVPTGYKNSLLITSTSAYSIASANQFSLIQILYISFHKLFYYFHLQLNYNHLRMYYTFQSNKFL